MASTVDYERLGKLTAYFVAIVYVIGVAVVNLRLAQFGISGMGLLREQYIFAGTWAILPILAVSIIVGVLFGFSINMRFELHPRPGGRGAPEGESTPGGSGRFTNARGTPGRLARTWRELRRTAARLWPVIVAAGRALWATSFLVAVAGIIFSYALNRAVPGATSAITTREFFTTGGKIALFAAGIGLCGAFAAQILRSSNDRWSLVLAAAMGLTTVILALAYLSFFAVSVYARIPSAIGGGADTRVALVLALDETGAARLGIPTPGVPTLRLLFVSGDMYYVVSPRDSTRAVAIPRANILGMETLH